MFSFINIQMFSRVNCEVLITSLNVKKLRDFYRTKCGSMKYVLLIIIVIHKRIDAFAPGSNFDKRTSYVII